MEQHNLGAEWRHVHQLGRGSFGAVQLYEHIPTKKAYAVKFVERGETIDDAVKKEVINHSMLQHNNIARFKEVILTDSVLAIVMEYASGGDLFSYVQQQRQRRLPENIARYFFQQLISGLGYMHSQQMCHRDMKLENTLLDGDPPKIKLCDFGYSKSSQWQSKAKSKVGTAAYIAPEVIVARSGSNYDGTASDVWSSGVVLHTMLMGIYPFCDMNHPNDEVSTIKRIMAFSRGEIEYEPPRHVSDDCKFLLSRMLTANPTDRITVNDIILTPWFQTNLPREFSLQGAAPSPAEAPAQPLSDVYAVLNQASVPRIQPSCSGLSDIPEMHDELEMVTDLTPTNSILGSQDFTGMASMDSLPDGLSHMTD